MGKVIKVVLCSVLVPITLLSIGYKQNKKMCERKENGITRR